MTYDLIKRYELEDLKTDLAYFDTENVFAKALDMVHNIVLILNETRQIIFINQTALKALGHTSPQVVLGKRPGEMVSCVHHATGVNGCGTSTACQNCNALNVILRTMDTHEPHTDLCRIMSKRGEYIFPLDFEVSAEEYNVGQSTYYVVTMLDARDKVRKEELERVFFHDIENTTGGLAGYLALLTEDLGSSHKEESAFIKVAFQDLIQNIEIQKRMLSQERGLVELKLEDIDILGFVTQLKTMFNVMDERYRGRVVVSESSKGHIKSDYTLLNRILINMVKNGLEASSKDSKVTLGCSLEENQVLWSVHSCSVIDVKDQQRIFQKNFSTKDAGRGWGTYSMRLLGETFLKGHVWFESDENNGTTFYFRHPLLKGGK